MSYCTHSGSVEVCLLALVWVVDFHLWFGAILSRRWAATPWPFASVMLLLSLAWAQMLQIYSDCTGCSVLFCFPSPCMPAVCVCACCPGPLLYIFSWGSTPTLQLRIWSLNCTQSIQRWHSFSGHWNPCASGRVGSASFSQALSAWSFHNACHLFIHLLPSHQTPSFFSCFFLFLHLPPLPSFPIFSFFFSCLPFCN